MSAFTLGLPPDVVQRGKEMADEHKAVLEEVLKRRHEAIEAKCHEAFGTGQDVAMWESPKDDGVGMLLAFVLIPGGSEPKKVPKGFERTQCIVFRTSQVKVGRA